MRVLELVKVVMDSHAEHGNAQIKEVKLAKVEEQEDIVVKVERAYDDIPLDPTIGWNQEDVRRLRDIEFGRI